MLECLMSWRWFKEPSIVHASWKENFLFKVSASPMLIDDEGGVPGVGSTYAAGESVFTSDRRAFKYMLALATRDLEYRGFRDERTGCFQQKQEASFLLYRSVMQCDNDAQYECLRQKWDTLNRPKFVQHK